MFGVLECLGSNHVVVEETIERKSALKEDWDPEVFVSFVKGRIESLIGGGSVTEDSFEVVFTLERRVDGVKESSAGTLQVL
nr:hypothetical transcript [Hymenolepis microstoma]